MGTAVLGAEKSWRIVALTIDGARRTDPSWLEEYLDLDLPAQMTSEDLERIRAKIMTTEVFQRVQVEPRLSGFSGSDFTLHVDLIEKWTTIPVIRGAYGGGTPLVVAGVHDTHTFGRLWTLGAEGRRYGTSPWGGVVWARAPRWLTGKHLVGLELWREFRERTIFDEGGTKTGRFNSSTSRVRGVVAAPLTLGGRFPKTNWQAGVDMEIKREAPVRFLPSPDRPQALPPSSIRLDDAASDQAVLLPTLIYDDLDIDGQNMHGIRAIVKSGPMREADGAHARSEGELFAYYLWPHDFNIAAHVFLGMATSNALQSQYFLGGLESIRGIPDGLIYGNRAAYGNLELRHISARWKYLIVQEALFVDTGFAGTNWRENVLRTTSGAGVRLSIPQVNRLTLRIDYAWAVDGRGGQGISIGLNQFFQPYRPL